MMHDLFGNAIEETEKTFKQEYDEYIRSEKWHKKAKQAIARAGEKCERCNLSKWSRRLEVHHLSYERFKNERPEDLEVVCKTCHKKADIERENRTRVKQAAALFDARFHGWALKVLGDGWPERIELEDAQERFSAWLERQGD